MTGRRWCRASGIVGVGVVALGVLAAGAQPAAAATTAPVPEPSAVGVVAAQAKILQAGRFADLRGVGSTSSVEATVQFRVPVVQCKTTTNTADFFALYAHGENPDAPFPPDSSVYVRVTCENSQPVYTTQIYQVGDRSGGASGTVAAGDVVRMRVVTTATATQSVLQDVTTGTEIRQRGTRFTSMSSAQVSAQAGDGTGARYPYFRSVTFTGATLRGVALGAQPGYAFSGPSNTASDPMQPGPLTGGTAFTVSWSAATG